MVAMPTHFRPEIEGLRAVAIAAVLLFHAGVPGAEGGFIGVDVFFVVSGFLITSLLLREWGERGRIDLTGFYARRFRRLLPAALLVIVTTVALSTLVLTVFRIESVAGDAVASALYFANIHFASGATEYLADTPFTSPLLHFWSLGVEEQFYLFWPVLLIVGLRLLKAPRKLWLVVGSIVIGSFALELARMPSDAPWAFFSLPTRAWQLGVGALIAIGVLRLPERAPARLAAAMSWAGLVVIALGVVVIDQDTPYPGTAALIPVIGTALVIVGTSHTEGSLSRFLSARFPRWLGRISYSLYLWHWPILVLVPIALRVDNLALNLGLLVVSALIAWASTELLEDPIRRGVLLSMRPRRAIAVGLAGSIAVAVAVFVLPPALSVELNPAAAALKEARDIRHPALTDGCHLRDLGDTAPAHCTYGRDGDVVIVLYGDSHALQWLPALESEADERGWTVVLETKSTCSPFELAIWHDPLKRELYECAEWRAAALESIQEAAPDVLVIAGARHYELITAAGPQSWAEARSDWARGMRATLIETRGLAGRVVMLSETPWFDVDPLECIADNRHDKECSPHRDEVIDPDYADLERDVAMSAGAVLVETGGWLCDPTSCPLERHGTIVYGDYNHLRPGFATSLGGRLGAAIAATARDDEDGRHQVAMRR